MLKHDTRCYRQAYEHTDPVSGDVSICGELNTVKERRGFFDDDGFPLYVVASLLLGAGGAAIVRALGMPTLGVIGFMALWGVAAVKFGRWIGRKYWCGVQGRYWKMRTEPAEEVAKLETFLPEPLEDALVQHFEVSKQITQEQEEKRKKALLGRPPFDAEKPYILRQVIQES